MDAGSLAAVLDVDSLAEVLGVDSLEDAGSLETDRSDAVERGRDSASDLAAGRAADTCRVASTLWPEAATR